MRTARAALALLLCLAVPVRAETTSDPLWTMLSTYVLAPDARAPEGEGDAKGLAGLQADLHLLAEGLEAFRDEEQVKASLERLHPRMSPELRPFFHDRTSSLDAVYRTLAVTDYTWAARLPEPPCGPGERRSALLGSEDRLFADEKGEASPWLVSLLGPQAKGKQASAALDQASARTRLAPAAYERLRAKARRLTLALASERAEGAARARLYCERADAYERLAAHHRTGKGGLIEASYSGAFAAIPSVLVVSWEGKRGAAVAVKTKDGTAVLTDAGLVADTGEPHVFYAGRDGQPVELKAKVKRRHAGLGLAELELSESRPALALAEKAPAVGDLTTSIGHLQIGGLWTRSSGLVAKSGEASFQTDAAISPEMLGAPVLNEDGAVAGVLSLRNADNKDGQWLVGVPAPLISRWMAGEDIPETAPPLEEIADSGTAAILSLTRPAPIETGLGAWNIPPMGPPPPTVRGVCVSNCGGPPRRSYSSGGSAYSSGSSAGAEMGQALGQALAPLVEAIIFRGIPALFRSIASLFKKKPGSASVSSVAQNRPTPAPKPVKPQPPPKPQPSADIRCDLVLQNKPSSIGTWAVAVNAGVECRHPEAPKEGHQVRFTLSWDDSKEKVSGDGVTDPQGLTALDLRISNAATIQAEVVSRAEDSIDELDRAAKEVEAEEREVEVPELAETPTGTEAGLGVAGAPPAPAAKATAAASRVPITIKSSGRMLRVKAELTSLAPYTPAVDGSGVPRTGKLVLGSRFIEFPLKFEPARQEPKVEEEVKTEEDLCKLKEGENIMQRFVDGSGLKRPGYLDVHEGKGRGHTILRHVGKSVAYLRDRLETEPWLTYASTFDDQNLAESTVRQAVELDIAAVTEWGSKRTKKRHSSFFAGPKHLGITISRSDPTRTPQPAFNAEVRLLQQDDCKIFVLSAFPLLVN